MGDNDRHLLIAITISFICVSVMFVFGAAASGADAITVLLVLLFMATIPALYWVASFRKRKATAWTRPLKENEVAFKRYWDCLEALCIGAGKVVVPLGVMDIESPLACVYHRNADEGGPPIPVVTNQLLAADFSYQEIEAIVAVLLAKTIVDTEGFLVPGDFNRPWVKELGLSDYLVGITRAEFQDDGTCLFCLLADANAARLTGHPEAIASAIRKSEDLLKANEARPEKIKPQMMFVEPPATSNRDYSFLKGTGFRGTGMARDRIIQLRLESLEFIEKGMRQAHGEVRDGVPVVRPEGWD